VAPPEGEKQLANFSTYMKNYSTVCKYLWCISSQGIYWSDWSKLRLFPRAGTVMVAAIRSSAVPVFSALQHTVVQEYAQGLLQI
jgi:hypothetical protein